MSRLVEEQVIAGHNTYGWGYRPLTANGEEGGLVLRYATAVTELVHGFNLVGFLYCGIVLHPHAGLEFILGTEVKGTCFEVDTQDGSNA